VWNAVDGTIRSAAIRRAAAPGPGATVALALEPYGSAVIVFPAAAGAPPAPRAPHAGPPPPPLDISGNWRVRFGRDGAPAEWAALRSWTEDEATRYFSGVATYEKQIDVPAAFAGSGLAIRLDFGEGRALEVGRLRTGTQAWLEGPVREAAVVSVNGRRAGSVWCPPYEIDVTALVRPGPNLIRIEVANLAINHMAGRALPDYKLLNLRYGTRFEPQDMDKVQPVPAGLFGPIRLVAAPAPPPAMPAR